jgi:LysR family glycine cleavage system transcriptional activator
MTRRLPPLNSLRAFEAAARHLSFKDAAAELNVTPGAVSQQVKQLEDHAGVALFKRMTRALALTEAGRIAAPRTTAAFDQLADAYELIRRRRGTDQLVVSVPPTFAARWLVPRLGRFQTRHPEIELRLDANNRLVDFARDDVDVGVRFGGGVYPGLVAECLLGQRVFPVCSPALLEGHPPLREPDDLRHHTLVHHQHPDAAEVDPAWAMWLEAAGVAGVDATRGPRFSTYGLATDAAAGGQGVALGDDVLVADDLASGRLVRPFAAEAGRPSAFGYFVVYPEDRGDDPNIAAFSAWLHAEAAAFTSRDHPVI